MKPAIALLLAFMLPLTAFTADDPYRRPARIPAPADNPLTPERIQLGKMLFFDPRMSGSSNVSCSTCHLPELGWSDGRPVALGFDGKPQRRASMTIVNAAYTPFIGWDGRRSSLEEQVKGSLNKKGAMHVDLEEALRILASIPGYAPLFERAYPGEGITADTMAKAIASFERSVVSGESSFDRWRAGNPRGLSASAQRGFKVFEGKGRCSTCHSGFNFSDGKFHNVGVKPTPKVEDLGRFAIVWEAGTKGAFKTPTLREIGRTSPYMHNGAYATLEEVVEHYDRGGDPQEDLSPLVKPLRLSEREKGDLVAFLRSLSSDEVEFVAPVLPR
ncbi:MAG TPA: cytochrome c peroxidase [Albitalea sp.]|uniref:cytochrome-c peroxidase n=1 Tax=Piscinibacter sp. TaxID=1903157 RepID=UPI002ED26EB3